MQPDDIQIQVRTRHAWEAIDLGFQMLRAWWKELYGAWFALAAPCMALWIYISWSSPWLTLIGLWWFKPVFERVPLQVLSEALFGKPPRVADLARRAPQWLRGGSLASLTLHRVSPSRSMLLPILQLEGLSGKRRSIRASQLVGPDGSRALWLLWACAVFQLFPITVGLGSFALALLPPETSLFDLIEDLWEIADEPTQLRALAIVYSVSLSIIEPLYVACGFALYINRRIFTEGWDIELVFRKLEARVRRAKRPARALAVLLLGLGMLGPLTTPAHAQRGEPERAAASTSAPGPCPVDAPEAVQRCIDEILSDPVFGGKRTSKQFRLRYDPGDGEGEAADGSGASSFGFQSEILSRLITTLALLLLGAAAVMLVRHVLHSRGSGTGPRTRSSAELMPDIRELECPLDAPLPADVIGTARRHFDSGDATSALSLLYRGALEHLCARGVPAAASATESECARLVRAHSDAPIAGDFERLVAAWELCAYADRSPSRDQFDQLIRCWELHLAS